MYCEMYWTVVEDSNAKQLKIRVFNVVNSRDQVMFYII